MKFGKPTIAAAVFCVANSAQIQSQAQGGWYRPGVAYTTDEWKDILSGEIQYFDFDWMDGLEHAVKICSQNDQEEIHIWCNEVVAFAYEDESRRQMRSSGYRFINDEVS